MYEIYTVKEGDTIGNLANNLGIDAGLLYSINGLNPNATLTPGNQIIIPRVQSAMFDYYTVKEGDNLYKIANTFNTSPEVLATLNGLDEGDYIYKDQNILVPKPDIKLYITKPGDTINSVAQQLQKNTQTLLSQNEAIYLLPEQLIVYREK